MTTLTYVLLALVFVAILGSSLTVNAAVWRMLLGGWRATPSAQRWFLVAFLATVVAVAVFVAGTITTR